MLTMKELEKLVDEQIRIFYIDANGKIVHPKEDCEIVQIVKAADRRIKVLVSL